MSYFKQTHIELGEIVQEKTVEVSYDISEGMKIESVVPMCGCTSAYVNHTDNKLVLIYTPNAIPEHLKEDGFYYANKGADVEYSIIGQEYLKHPIKLTFTAKIVEK